jgi:uncharacterized protein
MESHHLALKRILADIGPCLVAFSGGVDSTLLLKVAHDVLGDGAVAVTAVSASLPAAERQEAVALARRIGARHHLVPTREIEDPRYARNDARRCYFCKSELFTVLRGIAAARPGQAVVYGAIVDDLGDERPGMRAAAEAGARAPLLEAGMTKEMVRALSRRLGLPTWDKPAMACLASRIPRGTSVTAEALALVERAEAALRGLGYRQVRVRHHGRSASVELDAEGLLRAAGTVERRRLLQAVRAAGFDEARLDPLGYRPGGRTQPAPLRSA